MAHPFKTRVWRIALPVLLLIGSAVPPLYAGARFQKTPRLCALDEHMLRGQNWEFPGATSGLTTQVADTNNDLANPSDIVGSIPDIETLVALANASSNPVVVLVLDNFSSPSKSSSLALSHGHYVRDVARQFNQVLISEYGLSDSRIMIQQVDLPGFSLDDVVNKVNTAINSVNVPGAVFVLNMSFAVLPCEPETEIPIPAGGGDLYLLSFEEFLAAYEIGDLIVYETPDEPLAEPGSWQVLQAGTAMLGAGLARGDVITQFALPGDSPQAYDREGLLNFLSPLQETDTVELTVQGAAKPTSVTALELYMAARGYSLSLFLTEQVIAGAGSSIIQDWYDTQGVVDQALAAWLSSPGLWTSYAGHGLENLYGLLEDLVVREDITVIPVAAAGNFGNIPGIAAGPLAPGNWPDVVSVTGSLVDNSNGRWPPFNAGEIMTPGAWYPIGPEYVAGTSFSAPAASVLLALIQAASPSCSFMNLADAASNDQDIIAATTQIGCLPPP